MRPSAALVDPLPRRGVAVSLKRALRPPRRATGGDMAGRDGVQAGGPVAVGGIARQMSLHTPPTQRRERRDRRPLARQASDDFKDLKELKELKERWGPPGRASPRGARPASGTRMATTRPASGGHPPRRYVYVCGCGCNLFRVSR